MEQKLADVNSNDMIWKRGGYHDGRVGLNVVGSAFKRLFKPSILRLDRE